MTDDLLAAIEHARRIGATVLLKWDSERTERVCTILITDPILPFHFREDTDDPVAVVRESLSQFQVASSRGV